MDDDLYPGGYGYGSINNANQQQSDPEDLKREREALEAICQRASEYVQFACVPFSY
jgi:Late endosomal/lysosomal adaptor and MAPK and MTOR activator